MELKQLISKLQRFESSKLTTALPVKWYANFRTSSRIDYQAKYFGFNITISENTIIGANNIESTTFDVGLSWPKVEKHFVTLEECYICVISSLKAAAATKYEEVSFLQESLVSIDNQSCHSETTSLTPSEQRFGMLEI